MEKENWRDTPAPQPPLEVPRAALSQETVENLVESFILREGTDYGVQEVSLEAKKKQVLHQLDRGDILISFDPNTETVSLMTKSDWLRLIRTLPQPN